MERHGPADEREENRGFKGKRPKQRKPFKKPEIRREEPLKEITLFTSTANVTGASFFP